MLSTTMKVLLTALVLAGLSVTSIAQDERALSQYKSKYEERLRSLDQARDAAISNAPSQFRLNLQNLGKRFLGEGKLEEFEAVTNALQRFAASGSLTTNDIESSAPEQLRLAQKMFIETPAIEQRRWLQARQDLDRYYVDALEKLKTDLTRQALTNPASVKQAQAVREEIALIQPQVPLVTTNASPAIADPIPTNATPNRLAEHAATAQPKPSPPRPRPITLSPSLSQNLLGFYPLDGSGVDANGNKRNGTLVGTTPVADRFGQQNAALHFDGPDDSVRLNSGVWPKNATVCMWAKQGPGKNTTDIVRRWPWGFGLRYEEGVVVAFAYNVKDETKGYDYRVSGLADGRWHHLAITYGATGFIVYVDGLQRFKSTTHGTGTIVHPRGGSLHMGAIGGRAVEQDFSLDEVGLWDRQLMPSEISEVMNLR